MRQGITIIGAFIATLLLASCTYNPFISNNRTTGTLEGAAIGAGAGTATVALLGGPRFFYVPAILGGGALGYYFTTLRYESGGVIQSGGDVYRIGDNIGVYIPADQLFEPNTADFTPQAPTILDSAANILLRYPDNSVLISGSTSGIGRSRWQQKLSEQRAQKVAAYIWDQGGVNAFKSNGIDVRKLNYVGYGDYFPITTGFTNQSIRGNNRIQITSYPSNKDLKLDNRALAIHNIGGMNDDVGSPEAKTDECGKSMDAAGCFKDD